MPQINIQRQLKGTLRLLTVDGDIEDGAEVG